MTTPHWHVLGAGAIGCLFAQALHTVGCPVTLLRRAQADSGPLVLERDGEQFELSLPTATADNCTAISHLLITTKAYDVNSAVASVAPRLAENATLVLLVNGMGLAEQLRADHPSTDVYCGTTTEGAHRVSPRHIRHAGHGTTHLGQSGRSTPPDWFDAWQRSSLDCQWDNDIDAALWHKMAINAAINPLTAIHRCNNGALAERADLQQQVDAVCREICQISYAAGFTRTAQTLPQAIADVIAGTAQNRSSMLQDVSVHRRTEIHYITGHLLRVAANYGIPAPRNRALYNEVLSIDQ